MAGRLPLVFALLALSLGAMPAGADPIRITGGQLQMHGASGLLFLSGDRGFNLSAHVSADDGVFGPYQQCAFPECVPGVPIGLQAVWIGLGMRDAIATLDGETFVNVGGLVSQSSAAVWFSGTAMAPPFEGNTATVSVPFAFNGQFVHPVSGGSAITHSLFGWGRVRLSLRRNDMFPAWIYTEAQYEFDPVPEPATLLLTAIGIAGLAGVRRRRPR